MQSKFSWLFRCTSSYITSQRIKITHSINICIRCWLAMESMGDRVGIDFHLQVFPLVFLSCRMRLCRSSRRAIRCWSRLWHWPRRRACHRFLLTSCPYRLGPSGTPSCRSYCRPRRWRPLSCCARESAWARTQHCWKMKMNQWSMWGWL